MSRKLMSLCLATVAVAALAGCNQKPATPAATNTAPTLGIKPFGTDDPNFKPDYSKLSPEIAKVFQYIDTHIDEHVENLQKWVRQPSISNSGEGIPETAEMVKGFFDKLGCQTTRVYDVGITEYGTPGNPVGVREVRRGRSEDGGDLLAVRRNAGDAAGELDCSSVRGSHRERLFSGSAAGLACDHRPRCVELQGR